MDLQQGCRFCTHPLSKTFINLGTSPLSNAYLKGSDLARGEVYYPLHAQICEQCYLVQLPEFEKPEAIFSDYAYFSSYSDTWLEHAANYTEMMMERFSIHKNWQVIEIASNDGYLLQYFKQKNIPVLGIEPAQNVAKSALEKDIPTLTHFFGIELATSLRKDNIKADLLIANNVLAHVPNLNDFVAGLKILLSEQGVLTIEFPHLLRLIEDNQFDTIYHEHFSYFSLLTAVKIFTQHGLTIFDVEEVSVHGGSLRIFVKQAADTSKPVSHHVADLISKEKTFGLDNIETYQYFAQKIEQLKHNLLDFIIQAKKEGKKIAAYGAPAKGNTLLNYCGIYRDLLAFTVDKNPHKQNMFLPGTRIPIHHPEVIAQEKPDYLILLPWNLKSEIMKQMQHIKEWGGKFVIPIPTLQII